ncbi:hypothetical protein NL676_009708 [Syzygium grande]|nr:hypothetical protein NL676_009708 [Syzygium grande]
MAVQHKTLLTWFVLALLVLAAAAAASSPPHPAAGGIHHHMPQKHRAGGRHPHRHHHPHGAWRRRPWGRRGRHGGPQKQHLVETAACEHKLRAPL